MDILIGPPNAFRPKNRFSPFAVRMRRKLADELSTSPATARTHRLAGSPADPGVARHAEFAAEAVETIRASRASEAGRSPPM